MTPRQLIAAAAALLLILAAGRAAACSVTRDYVRPTNFELVGMADAIVVATAEGPAGKPQQEGMPEGVTFRVTATLKGQAAGPITSGFATIGRPTPSDPTDLTAANSESYAGPCSRMTYAKGASYVLFLSRDEAGAMRVIGIPFSRTSEDYLGEGSAWIRTIRLYLDVQRESDQMVQLTRLETLRGQLLARGDTLSKAQAADILDHLTSRSPWKPTAYLVQTWEALERGEQPRYPIRGPEANKELGEAQALTEALFGLEDGPYGRTEQMNSILASLVNGKHPGAEPLFARLASSAEVTSGQLGAAVRWYAANGQLRRAYELTRDRALGLLVGLPARQTGQLVGDIGSAMQGEDWDEGKEAWRGDPLVAAGWPKLALRIDRQQRLVLGDDGSIGFPGVLEALRPADYRADPEITLLLAGGYDQAVEDWALNQLKATPHATDGDGDDEDEPENPDRLPIQVLASSWSKGRNEALVRLFCQGGERRTLVIESLGRQGDFLSLELLDSFAADKTLSDDDRTVLGRALVMIMGRDLGADRGSFYANHDDTLDRIVMVRTRGKPAKAQPPACPG